jgi:tetratricopeptide (TPR) repeat protein
MIQPLGRATLGLALTMALAAASFTPQPARAADEEERRALKLSGLETQETQSEEYRRLAEEKRMESIERLRELLRTAEPGDRKAEMMLRLADLYFEQGQMLFVEELLAHQAIYDACFNTSQNTDACDPTPDNSESFGWYSKAVKLYEAILSAYPRYAKADQATYYLGTTRLELGEKEPALEAFKKLVKLYPSSTWVPDALIMIGEHYFDINDAFPALRAYLKATSYTDHPRYGFAMYKLAWCYYNVEEYGKAIDTMKRVVSYSMEQSAGDPSKVQLEEEALKDLVRFFADAGEMDEAYEYFTALGKKDLIRAMLKRLAGLYFEQGKFQQSVETYRRLVQETPTHAENPGYQEEIISAYRKIGDKNMVLAEIRRLRSDYGVTSAWWRANAANPTAQSDAAATIEKALRRVATEFNKEARDLDKAKHPRAVAAFDQAIEAYKVYLEDYSDNPNAYNVHYDFGELLWKLKRHEEAYGEYIKVVEMDPQGQHSRFCAESAIFAAEEMVKKEGGGDIKMKTVEIKKDTPPQPLTEWEKKLIAACGRYAELYKSDAKVETAIYKSAFLLYSRFHFTEAAEQFRKVISMSPGSSNAEFSAELILDALKIKEEWTSLRDTAKSFWQQPGLGSAAFKTRMYDIYSRSSFTVIEEDFKKHEDYSKTADAFVAFYEEFPEFEKVAFALNNAAAYYYKADRVADSMRVRHILIDDPKFGPKTKFYYGQLAALGYDYERLADFGNAALYYDKLVALYPEERTKLDKSTEADKADKLVKMDEQAAAALLTAAVFHNALGNWEGAVERYQKFLTLFPKDERALDTRLTIGKIYEDNKKWTESATAFSNFYKTDHPTAEPQYTFYARLHHGRALFEQGKEADARKLYAESVALYKKAVAAGTPPGPHTEFAAEMMFKLTEPEADAFLAVEIKGKYKDAGGQTGSSLQRRIKDDDKVTGDALKAKTKGILDLEVKYKEIIDTGAGEWGLAAIVALGKAYEDMSSTLETSPCPFYLTEDQCDIYKMRLQDKAYPQLEKSVQAYQLALDKSFELNLYNENTAYATRRLGELRPEDFPGFEETIPKPGYTAEKARVFEIEGSLE